MAGLSPAQRAEIERILSTTSPAIGHDAGQESDTPEPHEATTSRDNAAIEAAPIDPYVAEILRRELLERFHHEH